jgi:hypothetical protein
MVESRRMRWEGNVARMRMKRDGYSFLMGKEEEKRTLGRPKYGRWIILK